MRSATDVSACYGANGTGTKSGCLPLSPNESIDRVWTHRSNCYERQGAPCPTPCPTEASLTVSWRAVVFRYAVRTGIAAPTAASNTVGASLSRTPGEQSSPEARKPAVCSPPGRSRRSRPEPCLTSFRKTPSEASADEVRFTSFSEPPEDSLSLVFRALPRGSRERSSLVITKDACGVFRTTSLGRKPSAFARSADSLRSSARLTARFARRSR
jgi:hypothetical protein